MSLQEISILRQHCIQNLATLLILVVFALFHQILKPQKHGPRHKKHSLKLIKS